MLQQKIIVRKNKTGYTVYTGHYRIRVIISTSQKNLNHINAMVYKGKEYQGYFEASGRGNRLEIYAIYPAWRRDTRKTETIRAFGMLVPSSEIALKKAGFESLFVETNPSVAKLFKKNGLLCQRS